MKLRTLIYKRNIRKILIYQQKPSTKQNKNIAHILRVMVLFICWTFIFLKFSSSLIAKETSQYPLEKYAQFYEKTPKTTQIDDLNLNLDQSPVPDEDEIVRDAEKRLPSLPLSYWRKYRKFHEGKNASCAKYPSIYELEFHNIYWQSMFTSNGTFHLLNAFFDNRTLSPEGEVIRLLGMVDRVNITMKTFCQIWFEGRKKAVFSEIYEYSYIWLEEWGNNVNGKYQPYLMSCKIPERYQGSVPSTVSLVEHECDTATNNFRVIYNRPPDGGRKKGFAVCAKGLDYLYEDYYVRTVEWIEMMLILGAEKIYMYYFQLHPNISKVLDHYVQAGKVEVMPLTFPGWLPNTAGFRRIFLKNTKYHLQNEVISYNDCIHKNIHRYEYIAIIDIDEVIMPRGGSSNWREMIEKINSLEKSKSVHEINTYRFYNIYFIDFYQEKHGFNKDIPKYMYLLQHVHRAYNHTPPGYFIKSIHNTEHVLTVANHVLIESITKKFQYHEVEEQFGWVHHYRHECGEGNPYCSDSIDGVLDKSVWRYKDELIKRTKRTLSAIGFFRHRGNKAN